MSVRKNGLLGQEHDRSELVGVEDMASHREAEFLRISLLEQQVRAAGGVVVARGLCSFCHEACAPRAVYCDADCRDMHERELAALARNGGRLGPQPASGGDGGGND